MSDGPAFSARLDLRRVLYGHPDAASLTELAQAYYVSIYGSPDAAPVSDDGFAPPNGAFFVGYLGDVPVSMGGWRFSAAGVPAEAVRPAEVKRMYVREDVRGRGLARQMLTRLEADAGRAGADWMILETGQPQVAAIAFYRALGYRDIPAFGYYAGWPQSVTLGRPLPGDPTADGNDPTVGGAA